MSDNNRGVSILRDRIYTLYGDKEPEIASQLRRVHGDQGLMFHELMGYIGYQRGVHQVTTKTWEEDWIWQYANVGAGGITPVNIANGIYQFVLSANPGSNSYLPYSSASPYTQAQTPVLYTIPFEVNAQFMLHNGSNATVTQITGLGTNNVVLTIQFQNLATVPTVAELAAYADKPLSHLSNNWSEGSGFGTGRTHRPLSDTHCLQRIKTPFMVTGDQLGIKSYIKELEDKNTKKKLGYYFMYELQAQQYEHSVAVDNALLFGEKFTNPSIDPNTDEPRQATEGMWNYIGRRGTTLPTTAGAWNNAQFDAIADILDAQMAPSKYLIAGGHKFNQGVTNALYAELGNTCIDYTTETIRRDLFGGMDGGEARAILVNFGKYQKDPRFCFYFSTMPQFSNPRVFPAGYNMSENAIVAPLGINRRAKVGNSEDSTYFGCLYHQLHDGTSRKLMIDTLNGMGTTGSNRIHSEDDIKKYLMYSHIGMEYSGGSLMVRIVAE